MAILKVRDENGNIIEIKAIRGPRGQKPIRGTDYWTEADKEEIKAFCKNYIDSELSKQSAT